MTWETVVVGKKKRNLGHRTNPRDPKPWTAVGNYYYILKNENKKWLWGRRKVEYNNSNSNREHEIKGESSSGKERNEHGVGRCERGLNDKGIVYGTSSRESKKKGKGVELITITIYAPTRVCIN